MFKKIMVPVDLAHSGEIEKALDTAADLAKHYEAHVDYVGVTTGAPGSIASTPEEFQKKLEAFSSQEGRKHGISTSAKAVICADLAVDLDKCLSEAGDELESDMVVMGSHHPGIMEHLVSSNAGYLAAHSDVSVFVVR
jgi:nucleotide-binding universal stress UspA family protein